MILIAAYLLLGAVAGFIAGVFGLGGGVVIVPALIYTFSFTSISPEVLTHLAIGTSLASIIFTSLSAIYVHHKRQAIDWPLAYKLAAGMFIGGMLGAYIADGLDGTALQNIFACYALFVALQMWFSLKPKAQLKLPKSFGCTLLGSFVGFLSGLFGIGGGSLVVPLLNIYQVNITRAVAIASVTGFPVAISGTFGYLIMGLNAQHLPEHAIGYIYWPALLGIVVTSTYFAKLGAKVTHGLDPQKLKRAFAVLMLFIAIDLLVT